MVRTKKKPKKVADASDQKAEGEDATQHQEDDGADDQEESSF